ncbi:DUF2577 domain-containing protein [Geosporobacter ferrireducens]|uniref:DUF2577 domain-containing protein n=1 Tax=Geosporobacter ferrireducens TaxID=1424294 RepID=UPI00139DAA11|nr:DUF2577 domain-containing protein [Geosporobacter ferrireducens]MTI56163.1 DUF2577 domain-containing protein [Geosporobacter ferrireducens]
MNMIEIMKQAATDAIQQSKPVNVLFGTVQSINPLKIIIDQKLPLEADDLILTSLVKDRRAKISFDNPDIKNIVKDYSMDDISGTNYKLTFQQPIQNEITIYDGLKIGERVMLLRIQGGQKYIVLDRV